MATTIKTKDSEGKVRFRKYLEAKFTLEDRLERRIKRDLKIED